VKPVHHPLLPFQEVDDRSTDGDHECCTIVGFFIFLPFSSSREEGKRRRTRKKKTVDMITASRLTFPKKREEEVSRAVEKMTKDLIVHRLPPFLEKVEVSVGPGVGIGRTTDTLSTPGLDNTRLFISFTAGAGTRCMSLLSSSPSLSTYYSRISSSFARR